MGISWGKVKEKSRRGIPLKTSSLVKLFLQKRILRDIISHFLKQNYENRIILVAPPHFPGVGNFIPLIRSPVAANTIKAMKAV